MEEQEDKQAEEKPQDKVRGELWYEWLGSKLDSLPKNITNLFDK